MTPERYQLIKLAFFEASAAKGEAREAVLQRHCHDDASLRREVENLLAVRALDTSEVNVPFQPDAPGIAQIYEAGTRRRLFGEGHPELTYSLNDIGDAMMDRGDYAAAEPYLRESMGISLAAFPPGHHRRAVAQNLWSKCRAGQGAFAEAEEALMAANEVFFRVRSRTRSWRD